MKYPWRESKQLLRISSSPYRLQIEIPHTFVVILYDSAVFVVNLVNVCDSLEIQDSTIHIYIYTHPQPCPQSCPGSLVYPPLNSRTLQKRHLRTVWQLSMASFRFCETYLLHIRPFVVNKSAISPFLGGLVPSFFVLFLVCLYVCVHECLLQNNMRMHMSINIHRSDIAGVPFDSVRRFRATLLLRTTCMRVYCNWFASCVAA